MQQIRIGTHSGHFHLDEVLACALLTKYTKAYKNAEITRSRDLKILDQLDLVCDVGGVYNPLIHRYDHHQNTFTETLSEDFKTKLSSAGLIYKHFGHEIIQNALEECLVGIKLNIKAPHVDEKVNDLIYIKIYDNFIQAVDAIDNGINQYENPGEPNYSINTILAHQIARMNPMWTEVADENERFRQAMVVADKEFITQLRGIYLAWLPARQFVEEAVANRKMIHETGEIIKLETSVPWKSHLHDLEKEHDIAGQIKFVLYQDTSEGWRVQGINLNKSGFELRQQIKKAWCGIKDLDLLKKTSNIHDVVFVHASGFVGGARSYESALRMAQESL